MGRLFVRAILSQCLGFAVSILALSVGLAPASSPRGRAFDGEGYREFVENARLKRKEFVNVIKMRRRY